MDALDVAAALSEGVKEVRPPPICKFFIEGRCNRGSRCRFRHELDDAYYASIDENHDGMWSYAGLNGMMMMLSDVDQFMMDQDDQWKFDKGERPELKREDEFVKLNLETFEEFVGPSMRERGLTVAHGVTRRMCEENGLLPPLFRITRVSEEEMSELLATKQSGNQQFMAGMYKEAFDSYENAWIVCSYTISTLLPPVRWMRLSKYSLTRQNVN